MNTTTNKNTKDEKERQEYINNVLKYNFPDSHISQFELIYLEFAIQNYEEKMEKQGISKNELLREIHMKDC
jgi:hypothetical protein